MYSTRGMYTLNWWSVKTLIKEENFIEYAFRSKRITIELTGNNPQRYILIMADSPQLEKTL